MDFVRLADALRDASPWVVLGITVIAIVYRVLAHRERINKRSELAALFEQIDQLSTVAAGIRAACDETQHMVSTQESSQTRLLEKAVQELVNLNAATSGSVITMENAKLMISYQWSWCRDETIRLIINSLDNNHFIGNEPMIARRIFRAWKQAAQSAKQSLDKLSGMRYPYQPLFDSHVQMAWKRAWEWAIPLYHGDFRDREVALEDLKGRMRLLFDDILEAYYRVVEDIDEGTLYTTHDSSALALEGFPIDGTSQGKLVDRMGEQLKNYQKGESDDGSGGYNTVETKEAVRELHRQECRTRRLEDEQGP